MTTDEQATVKEILQAQVTIFNHKTGSYKIADEQWDTLLFGTDEAKLLIVDDYIEKIKKPLAIYNLAQAQSMAATIPQLQASLANFNKIKKLG